MELFEGSAGFGKNVNWWIGIVAPRSAWATSGLLINDKEVGIKKLEPEVDVYYNRVKVKVVGYHDNIRDPNDLPWANILSSPMIASGYGGKDHTHSLEGGESVFGFWMDGEDEQKPCIVGVFYRHKKADDTTVKALKGSAGKPVAYGSLEGYYTRRSGVGDTRLGNLGTGDVYEEVDYSVKPTPPNPNDAYFEGEESDPAVESTDGYTNDVTGRVIVDKTKFPTPTNQPQSKGMTPAAAAHHQSLNRKTTRPTCRKDGAIAEITEALADFTEFLLTVQGYANFYVNGVTGALTNIQNELSLIAGKIAKIMTGVFNKVRDYLFSQIGKGISDFIGKSLADELVPIFGEANKKIMDTIYCIFENLIKALLKTITDFLIALVGNFVNAPLCAAEQFMGALMNKLLNDMTSAIGPILDTLTETLGGALGSVNEIIDQALKYIGIIYKFIGCDEKKCPLPSSFSNSYGPSQKERDNANKIFSSISILNITTSVDENGQTKQTVGGFLDEASSNVDSMFGLTPEDQANAQYVASIVGGCPTKVLRCGPPVVEIFGGDGIGGAADAVVSNLGEIIGVNVTDVGFGYSPEKPPYVTFRDSCNNGAGARGRAIIGDDGTIVRIVLDYGGYGYLNNFRDVITTEGTIPGNLATGDEIDELIGQIDTVEILNPGFAYNKDDTLTVDGGDGRTGGAELKPIIIGGRIVGVEVINPGTGFTSIPEITINSETGLGADLGAVLKFTKVTELSQPLDPTKIVQVINCVSK